MESRVPKFQSPTVGAETLKVQKKFKPYCQVL